MSYLICEGCRKIIDFPKEDNGILRVNKREFFCKCGCSLTMENCYPPLSSQDFVHSSKEIYETSKEHDKENLNRFCRFLEEKSVLKIDKTELDAYLNQYEKIRGKYEDNERKCLTVIDDEFEEYLIKKMPFEKAVHIVSAVRFFNKNKFRKPVVIMIASLIEQLFNDYFDRLVDSKLSDYGTEVFLKNYNSSGVQKCIDISDAFLEESLESKMDRYKKGFYSDWAELRKKRNAIIHRNNTYVSKIDLSRYNRLIGESVKVFAHLTSELFNKSDSVNLR